MPKVLSHEQLPAMPPMVDPTTLDERVRRMLLDAVTDEPRTWRIGDAQHLPGVPWWIEARFPYFTAREIMLALGIDRDLFNRLHDEGRIPGASWARTDARQKHLQRVVLRIPYVREAMRRGRSWFFTDDEPDRLG